MIHPVRFFSISSFLIFSFLFLNPACPARVVYVSPAGVPDGTGSSWLTAFPSINAALVSAASGDEIWVRSATYSESIEMKEGVALYGGFVGTETNREERDWENSPTVIDASGLNRSVVIGANHAILDGFTVTGGSSGYGGGVYCSDTSPLLMNCRITGNTARFGDDIYKKGGGVYCYNSFLMLIDCTIDGNSITAGHGGRGGGIYISDSSPTLTNCTIMNNLIFADYGSGGGIFILDASPTLTNCTVAFNRIWASNDGGGYGGGVYLCRGASPSLHNCTITDNSINAGNEGLVRGGGIYCNGASPSLNNCTITGNSSSGDGGGLYCCCSSFTISDCTITDNSTSDYGGGMCLLESSPTIAHCTLAGNSARYGGGAYCKDTSPTITNCSFQWNSASRGGSVYCSDSSPAITNCLIIRNSCKSWGGGVYCYESSPVLTNCVFTGNLASSGGGVACTYSSPNLTNCIFMGNSALSIGGGVYSGSDSFPTMINCTIVDNMAYKNGSGIYCGSQSSPTLINSIIWNQGKEIYVEEDVNLTIQYSNIQGSWPGEGNIDKAPLFVDADGDNYHLNEGSPCIDLGLVSAAPEEDFEGNPRPGADGLVDMGAYESPDVWQPTQDIPTRWYVRVDAQDDGDGFSWATAFHSVTAALRVASPPDEIWVQGGIYYEAILLEPDVVLYGGFAGNEKVQETRDWHAYETIINATGLNRTVVVGADNAILDGFTITGGSSEYGGGVNCWGKASPLLANCTIKGNSASYGAGVCCWETSPKLVGCNITGNKGQGIHSYHSSFSLTNCLIAENSGGGINCEFSSPTITHCIITRNRANHRGGVSCEHSPSVTLTNCLITENAGGVNSEHSSTILTNCLIIGNAGYDCGGVYSSNDSLSLINCTLADNEAIWGGSGIHARSKVTVINCILWNRGQEIEGKPDIQYSCIKEGWEGEGNIDSDPLFVDAAGGDYHLQAGSPCIDAGSPDVAFNDGCLPPGLGGVRNDMGVYGGPGNCRLLPEIPTPTPTPVNTATPAPFPTSTPTPTPFITPLPGQYRVWVLDGQGRVEVLEGKTNQ